ncbi:MAG: hypothetical protein IPG89_15595 [Bacteroidetes bacterium]|nr:hypothetical protein [Bacteroidota bacterium]
MNKIFFSLLFCVFLFKSNAQQTSKETFNIKNNLHPENASFFEMAIMKSSMGQYRLQDERFTIKCENGFELELLSANELKASGFDIDPTNFQTKAGKTFYLQSFKIVDGGQIVLKHKEYYKGIEQ